MPFQEEEHDDDDDDLDEELDDEARYNRDFDEMKPTTCASRGLYSHYRDSLI